MPKTTMPARCSREYTTRGFTLVEMMIVVAIAAILAAIALPMYQKYVMQSRRTTAKTALLDAASREERYYSTNNNYTMDLSQLGYTIANGAISVPSTNQTFYLVSITPPTAGATSASSYTLSAVPQGSQSNDACGTYTLTDLGIQGNTGGTQTSGCW